MNRGQGNDLQFLGFLGIFKESFRLIFTWRKIFTQITLAFIFPYSFIHLAYAGISTFLSSKITKHTSTLTNTQIHSPTYNTLSNSIFSDWIVYSLINVVYFVLSSIFFLLSTSAVVYTTACVYSDKNITFKRVLSVVPKVWKRVMITFLCVFCVIFLCAFIFAFLIVLLGLVIFYISTPHKSNGWQLGIPILVVIGSILSLMGLIYVGVFWQLAYVISVLEKHCGFKAMTKSKALIKGNTGTSLAIYLVLMICSLPTYLLLKQMRLRSGNVVEKFWYGILTLVWSTFLSLLHLVVQTVLYFVCKSYHNENVDKSSLADHLEGYSGEYAPLNPKIGQLEDLNV